MVFLSALLLRVYERTVPGTSLEYFWNCIWLIFVTQTTVGYGDMYPQTHLGRGFIMSICMLGTFLISYFVISTAKVTECESEESNFIKFYGFKRETGVALRPSAITTIQRWWRFMLKRKRKQSRILEIWRFRMNLMKFTLKRKKLFAEESESIGDLADAFTEKKNQAFLEAVTYLKGLKQVKVKQTQFWAMQQQFKIKLDRYEILLKKYYVPRPTVRAKPIRPHGMSVAGGTSSINRQDWSKQAEAVSKDISKSQLNAQASYMKVVPAYTPTSNLPTPSKVTASNRLVISSSIETVAESPTKFKPQNFPDSFVANSWSVRKRPTQIEISRQAEPTILEERPSFPASPTKSTNSSIVRSQVKHLSTAGRHRDVSAEIMAKKVG